MPTPDLNVSNWVKDEDNNSERSRKAFDDALQYWKAAEILDKGREKDVLFSPILMLATFSCELFSKAILYYEKEQGEVSGHELKKLYDDFPINVKNEIKVIIKNEDNYLEESYSEERFIRFLEQISDEFSKWRYRFEYVKNNSNYSFALDYPKILKKVSENLYGIK